MNTLKITTLAKIPRCLISNRKRLYKYNEYDPKEFLIFDDRKLIYLVNSKVACTSIKTTIGNCYEIKAKNNYMDIHENPMWNRMYGNLPNLYSKYYKFSFVRNPLDRIVSCYKDKILNSNNNNFLSKPYFENNYCITFPKDISFEEFVTIISAIPDFIADRHFKSQYSIIYNKNKKIVDFIGKFENLSNDWTFLANKFTFDQTLVHQHKTNKVQNEYEQFYTKRILDIVYKRYKNDFTYFGYEDTFQQVFERIR